MKQRFELLGAAVAFAEAGDHDTARRMIDGLDAVRASARRKMLLVSTGSPFAGCVMDYALGLAERLGRDIVALSVLGSERKGLGALLGQSTRRMATVEAALGSYRLLKERAAPLGIRSAHVVACGEGRSLVEEMCHAIKGVEFAIVQQDGRQAVDVGCALPVYLVKC